MQKTGLHIQYLQFINVLATHECAGCLMTKELPFDQTVLFLTPLPFWIHTLVFSQVYTHPAL